MTRAGRGYVDSGLFEVYEAPADEGTDALAHILREDAAHRIIVICHTLSFVTHKYIDCCARIVLKLFPLHSVILFL